MLYTVSNGEIISVSPEQVIESNIELATAIVNEHKDDAIRQRIKGLEADLAGTIVSNRKVEEDIKAEIEKLQKQILSPSTEMDQI